jgi:hypothetical protein
MTLPNHELIGQKVEKWKREQGKKEILEKINGKKLYRVDIDITCFGSVYVYAENAKKAKEVAECQVDYDVFVEDYGNVNTSDGFFISSKKDIEKGWLNSEPYGCHDQSCEQIMDNLEAAIEGALKKFNPDCPNQLYLDLGVKLPEGM